MRPIGTIADTTLVLSVAEPKASRPDELLPSLGRSSIADGYPDGVATSRLPIGGAEMLEPLRFASRLQTVAEEW